MTINGKESRHREHQQQAVPSHQERQVCPRLQIDPEIPTLRLGQADHPVQ